MAVVAILLTISLATMFVGLTMGAGYKANMKAYYPMMQAWRLMHLWKNPTWIPSFPLQRSIVESRIL